MKKMICGLGVLLTALAANAAVYSSTYNSGFANSGVVPDGNLTGWADSRLVSGLPSEITQVEVRLKVNGGYNGDLYAYLTYGGTLVPLLNRTGVGSSSAYGYGDNGFDVTFSSVNASQDVHLYRNTVTPSPGQPLTGFWQPDGRNISPLSPGGDFEAAAALRVALSAYNGKNPNGTWALFLADLSGGGVSTVESWGLDITAVPEPINIALGAFALWMLFVVYRKGWLPVPKLQAIRAARR